MVHLQPWRVNYNIWIILHADKIYNSTPARQPGKLSIALQINDKNKNRAVVGKLHDATKILFDMECIVSWRLPWKKRWSSHLRRLIKTCLKFSRWIRILLDFELSKAVLFIKSRKTRWGQYVWVNTDDLYNCIAFALLFIYSVHTNVCGLGGTTGQLLPLTLQEGVLGEWNCYVLLIHQLENRTVWRVGWMKRLLLFDQHFGTIHSLALLLEKIFAVTPTSPKVLTCWISQILNIHFTCI